MRLVGAAIQHIKNRGGGRIYGASSEQDMMQEGCIALIKVRQREAGGGGGGGLLASLAAR